MSRNSPSFSLWLFPWLGLVAACGRPNHSSSQAIQEMEGFTMTETLKGKPAWSLSAESAKIYESARTAQLREPELEFYKDGRPSARLKARLGVLDTETHDVTLSSSVVGRSLADGSSLWTERLRYGAKAGKIFTEEAVRLKTPQAEVRGKGLEANPDLSELRIREQQTVFQ